MVLEYVQWPYYLFLGYLSLFYPDFNYIADSIEEVKFTRNSYIIARNFDKMILHFLSSFKTENKIVCVAQVEAYILT